MRGRLTTIAAATAMMFAAAPAPAQDGVDPGIEDGSEQRALDAARERWRDAAIDTYRFRVRIVCFCAPNFTRPAVIVVRDGRPVDPPRRLRRVATVPRLHREVQRAIDDRVDGLSVRYGRRGVPRSISIDPSRMIADEETGYVVDWIRAG
jgi:Family of unknown function (DUF6174)